MMSLTGQLFPLNDAVFQGRAGSVCVVGPKGQKVCSSNTDLSVACIDSFIVALIKPIFVCLFFNLLFRVFPVWWVLRAWLESLAGLDLLAFQGTGSRAYR